MGIEQAPGISAETLETARTLPLRHLETQNSGGAPNQTVSTLVPYNSDTLGSSPVDTKTEAAAGGDQVEQNF